jgi:hypothetical protein
MRRWIIGIGLLVAVSAAAPAQDASDEIVTGFLGGTSQPSAAEDPVLTSGSVHVAGGHAAVRHRTTIRSTRRTQTPVKARTPLQPIIIPRPPEPAPRCDIPAERVTVWGNVQWDHPLAIGAGLTPVLLAAVLAGIRGARSRKAVRSTVPAHACPPDADGPAQRGAALAVAAQAEKHVDGNTEARIARQFRTGQGEIRLARLIERTPKSTIRKMQEFAVRPDDAGGDTGIARNLHVGRGEVRLALRLQQLAGHEQIEGELQ